MRKNEKKNSNRQVPYLGNMPGIGTMFFKKTDRDDVLTELVVFITPHIVQGEKLVTGDEQASKSGFKSFRDYQPLKPVEH
jgi:type II secretory pathway component GspD/PulD (secretin)